MYFRNNGCCDHIISSGTRCEQESIIQIIGCMFFFWIFADGNSLQPIRLRSIKFLHFLILTFLNKFGNKIYFQAE
jgi:hypothetical protein